MVRDYEGPQLGCKRASLQLMLWSHFLVMKGGLKGKMSGSYMRISNLCNRSSNQYSSLTERF